MVEPFRAVMKTATPRIFVLAAITYVISLFFWPTPAVPLVSAVLLPAAIAAGLPPLGGALAIAIAGQGMALSSDYVIGVAPGISAKAAGAAVSAAAVADRALVLSLITGIIALVLAYFSIRKLDRSRQASLARALAGAIQRWRARAPRSRGDLRQGRDRARHRHEAMKSPSPSMRELRHELSMSTDKRRAGWSQFFAIVTPVAFAMRDRSDGAAQTWFRTGLPELKGGDAAALVGGMGAALMILASLAAEGPRKAWTPAPTMSPMASSSRSRRWVRCLPIAGFFFLGAGGDLAAGILNVPVAQAPTCCSN